ncbi:MAG: hypothetical protein Q8O34_10205 [Rhodocyclaceae bacterium]|nr:hypothetical protein [Rhodocyclaceae bacterium]
MAHAPEFDHADEAIAERCDAERRGDGAMSSAVPSRDIPTFSFVLSNPRHRNYRCISAADEVFHRIGDVDEFFAALGYTKEMRKDSVIPDEFIWDRYTRDGAVMSAQCVQAHIVAFLHRHSAKFRERYGQAYALTTGKCFSDCIDGSDAHCADCSRHPPSCI